MWFLNMLPEGARRAVFPVALALSALCLSPMAIAQVANVTGVASGMPVQVMPSSGSPLGGVETLGWSGLIGFLIYMLDRKDKSNAEAQKSFTSSLEAKDKTIAEMSSAHAARVEKFLQEAQDVRAGESERLHSIFDKLIERNMPVPPREAA